VLSWPARGVAKSGCGLVLLLQMLLLVLLLQQRCNTQMFERQKN
jgi:hypothetical protein